MGGNALKNLETPTRRYERDEFDNIIIELVEILQKSFYRVSVPLFYKNKQTFGDADILIVSNPNIYLRDYIQETFNPNEIYHNGNCWSFDYKEFQIDLITSSVEHFDSNLMYLSYNDLGNFIGRIAHGFGLKYGQSGLWYEHYFKGKNIGPIQISKDYPKIFSFLGLSYERYEKGFDELEDIFTFISSSQYFNFKLFQLKELNKVNRDRNKKRKTYSKFLEWGNQNASINNFNYDFNKDKTVYLKKINDFFPESNLIEEIRKLEYFECKKLYISSKFNGYDVMTKYGFEGKILGDKLKEFKSFIVETVGDFDEYIISTDKEHIYQQFEKFLNMSI